MATSVIKGGVETFVLTLSGGINAGNGYGVYDKVSGIVRINFYYVNPSAITTSTPIFTVPSAYRPSEEANGSGVVWTGASSSPAMTGSKYRLAANGAITQTASANATRGFGYIEYKL